MTQRPGPPPVRVRAAGGPAWRVLQIALPALAAAVAVHWAVMHATDSDRPQAAWAAAAVALVLGAVAARHALGPPSARELAWDGMAWRVDGALAAVRPMVDLDGWLLLRWHLAPALTPPPHGNAGKAGGGWLAVTRAEAGGAMGALRAALYCAAPEPPGRAAAPRLPD